MLQSTTLLEETAGHNVFKTDANEGPILQIGEWQLNWKAQGVNTGYSFSIFEMTLAPGNGLPLHKHPYPEFFYVLEGNLDFCRWNNAGAAKWMTCAAGTSVLAPSNAPHTFLNKAPTAFFGGCRVQMRRLRESWPSPALVAEDHRGVGSNERSSWL